MFSIGRCIPFSFNALRICQSTRSRPSAAILPFAKFFSTETETPKSKVLCDRVIKVVVEETKTKLVQNPETVFPDFKNLTTEKRWSTIFSLWWTAGDLNLKNENTNHSFLYHLVISLMQVDEDFEHIYKMVKFVISLGAQISKDECVHGTLVHEILYSAGKKENKLAVIKALRDSQVDVNLTNRFFAHPIDYAHLFEASILPDLKKMGISYPYDRVESDFTTYHIHLQYIENLVATHLENIRKGLKTES